MRFLGFLITVTLLLSTGLVFAGLAMAAPTYVQRGGFQTWLRHPRNLSFSVDGDLEGLGLRWKHWGGGFTIAHGTIYERQGYPSYSTTRVAGAIKLDQRRRCNGAFYYTHAVFYPNGPLLFRAGPLHLYTPCDSG